MPQGVLLRALRRLLPLPGWGVLVLNHAAHMCPKGWSPATGALPLLPMPLPSAEGVWAALHGALPGGLRLRSALCPPPKLVLQAPDCPRHFASSAAGLADFAAGRLQGPMPQPLRPCSQTKMPRVLPPSGAKRTSCGSCKLSLH